MIYGHFTFLYWHSVAISCRLGVHWSVLFHLLVHEIVVEDICTATRRVIPEEKLIILTVLPLRLCTNCADFLVLLVDSWADWFWPRAWITERDCHLARCVHSLVTRLTRVIHRLLAIYLRVV